MCSSPLDVRRASLACSTFEPRSSFSCSQQPSFFWQQQRVGHLQPFLANSLILAQLCSRIVPFVFVVSVRTVRRRRRREEEEEVRRGRRRHVVEREEGRLRWNSSFDRQSRSDSSSFRSQRLLTSLVLLVVFVASISDPTASTSSAFAQLISSSSSSFLKRRPPSLFQHAFSPTFLLLFNLLETLPLGPPSSLSRS